MIYWTDADIYLFISFYLFHWFISKVIKQLQQRVYNTLTEKQGQPALAAFQITSQNHNPWDLSVRSYEEIRGTLDIATVDWSSLTERFTSTTVNGDCTSRLHNVWRVRLDGGHRDGDRHHNTSLVDGVVWRRKSTKLWALSRLQSHIRTLRKLICI